MPDLVSNPPVAPPYQLASTRHGTMLINRNDIYMGQSLLRYGECCEFEINLLLRLIASPGPSSSPNSNTANSGLVLEVGSNMGVHTIPLARELARQNRSMLAFEPQPVIFQQLCANLALNGLMNVTAYPYACGASPGIVSFQAPDYQRPGNFGGTAMSSLPAAPSTHTVSCCPLDSFVHDATVALLKIDVEGHELRVLQGARNILSRSRPILYVENDRIDRSPELIQWLLTQGYRLWWHITPAFNPDNFLQLRQNFYGSVSFINMLCVHRSHNIAIQGLPEIIDPSIHPFARDGAVISQT
jgi:FkbM family methyltransferase